MLQLFGQMVASWSLLIQSWMAEGPLTPSIENIVRTLAFSENLHFEFGVHWANVDAKSFSWLKVGNS